MKESKTRGGKKKKDAAEVIRICAFFPALPVTPNGFKQQGYQLYGVSNPS